MTDSEAAASPHSEKSKEASIGNKNLMLERAAFLAYREALNQQAIVSVADRTGRITDVNDQFVEISGYTKSELIGSTHRIVNSGCHDREFFASMWKAISRGDVWRGDICNRAKSGTIYWVDSTIAPIRPDGGEISGYVSIRFDVTERKVAESSLYAENEKRLKAEMLLRDIIGSIPNGITAFDENDRLVLYNDEFARMYSRVMPRLRGGESFATIMRLALDCGQFRNQASSSVADRWLGKKIAHHHDPGRLSIEHLNDGRWIQLQERRTKSGYIVGVRTDITDIKLAEQKLIGQSIRDHLTGLNNRVYLQDRLTSVLADEGLKPNGAFLLIDLDRFKSINDTMGHAIGDQLLVHIAQRLMQAIRPGDVVARLGGDEFALILPGVIDRSNALRIIRRIHNAIGAPMELESRKISMRCSTGVAFYPGDGTTAEEILKNADIALYKAKAAGRGIHCFFEVGMRNEIEGRERLAEHLRQAIADETIEIALQPQVNFLTGKHSGFEALARWSVAGAAVPPSTFVPLAEENGLISALGQLVLDRALRAFSQARRQGLGPELIAVNVAAAQLRRPEFENEVLKLLSKYCISPNCLEFEVTENVMLGQSADGIIARLQALRKVGVRLALDDFGTGYASLSHLAKSQFDRIKIDRSFITNICASNKSKKFVKVMLSMGEALDVEVVVEGIETREQYDLLKEIGCQCGQGYLIGMPMTPDLALDYLLRRTIIAHEK